MGESERLIAVAHELTKVYAFMKRGTPQELLTYFTEHEPKGEFVVLIAPQD